MKYLGIDYGVKRLGAALSDDGGTMAFPYRVLANTPKLIDELNAIAKKHEVSGIVVGESLDYSGKPNPVMKEIKTFARELEAKTGIAVQYEPEFLTSAQARHIQGDSRTLDASAAAIILQSFLDKKNQ
ncbi:MAG: Holliday junction resolvase RuvX [Candidatus Lloydbacteria bacterium]|nr:Holliday junction resolvase RuvX [Candidatus Lloydbacteria bacterium]